MVIYTPEYVIIIIIIIIIIIFKLIVHNFNYFIFNKYKHDQSFTSTTWTLKHVYHCEADDGTYTNHSLKYMYFYLRWHHVRHEYKVSVCRFNTCSVFSH